MSMTSHPRDRLSAYLDGAALAAERQEIEAHLATCPDCRARLAELRGVAALIASLPDVVPSRRLVPRIAGAPAWLAPLRTLATLTSGVFVFLFIASAILANVGWLAGGSGTAASRAGSAPLAAPAASAASSAAPRDLAAASRAPSASGKEAPSAPPAEASTPVAAYAAQASPAARPSGTALGPGPWTWLVLAIVSGAIAIALQRRLRSA